MNLSKLSLFDLASDEGLLTAILTSQKTSVSASVKSWLRGNCQEGAGPVVDMG
ncbi:MULTISPECIES: hypothetical protein [unclassified Rhodococcus (in: high G+C Gram-positive bacteria)]|uniref:hypothetical protein n=1 Tax=unclassified Rhodococcus (in: high G+C Gram-positive bacteria) TaxID=192944 RepID=UPI0016395C2B|nr:MULTISPECIES: hypothetical protein [unclassified Rhodococcus (in: high G+C Gram-positive bacteria)]MBC2637925.1 hypothetical protein [Rhodococcus sp. 3A]